MLKKCVSGVLVSTFCFCALASENVPVGLDGVCKGQSTTKSIDRGVGDEALSLGAKISRELLLGSGIASLSFLGGSAVTASIIAFGDGWNQLKSEKGRVIAGGALGASVLTSAYAIARFLSQSERGMMVASVMCRLLSLISNKNHNVYLY